MPFTAPDQSITLLYNRSITHLILILSMLLMASSNCLAIPFELPPREELTKLRSATIITSKGNLNFELFPDESPWHVANFKYLADKGFYRGKTFHIQIDDFIIQAGANNDPRFTYFLPPEFSSQHHSFGTLGMARAPDDLNPQRNSSATQFHLLLSDAKRMDGHYTVFGRLIGGEEILHKLKRGDRILDLKVFVSSD